MVFAYRVLEPRPLPRHNWTPGLFICVEHPYTRIQVGALRAYLQPSEWNAGAGHKVPAKVVPAKRREE